MTATPYQILCAVQLLQTIDSDFEADLCILDQFSSAKNLAEKLKKKGLFSSVFLVRYNGINKGNFFVRSCRKIGTYFQYQKIAEKYFPQDTIYDEVYLSFLDFIFEFAISYYKVKNPNLAVHLFEDGTASYTYPELILKRSRSWISRWIGRLTGMPFAAEPIGRFYVFEPKQAVPRSDGSRKDQLKKIDLSDSGMISLYNELFEFDAGAFPDRKFIFLEQAFNGLEPDRYQLDFFTRIREKLSPDSYVLKLHPRTVKEAYNDFYRCPNSGIPWEILCLNGNMEDRVLVCYFSTASFTPKILFGQEPELIFFLDLYHPFPGIEEMRAHIDRLVLSYQNPEKIHILKSFAELDEILEKIGGDHYPNS